MRSMDYRRKAGLRTIGVLCGGFAEEDLRSAGCIAIYESPAALLEQLEQLEQLDSSPLK
jgi:phosphoglycolate phosphatase-like HAD superfamily hydrolase